MKIYCENDNEIEVPYNSLDGAILENLDLCGQDLKLL